MRRLRSCCAAPECGRSGLTFAVIRCLLRCRRAVTRREWLTHNDPKKPQICCYLFMAQRRIALFGGTFDPIHLGHTQVAQAAATRIDAEKVVFIPAKCSPLKGFSP